MSDSLARRAWRLVMVCWVAGAALATPSTRASDLLTVAESSNFQRTATYAEVMDLCRRLAALSPQIDLQFMGVTNEGRQLPLLVLSSSGVRSAAEAAADDRLVVFALGNIHAGEVCGKEALLMLAREIAEDPKHPLLDDLVILLAPIYNADGNDRMAPNNRRGQKGPSAGMGQRPNAQGLDLNRDFVKLEAPETRAMLDLFNDWDPAIIIDTHTTNGSHHQYVLTYGAPKNPAGDPRIITFTRDTMLPAVSEQMQRDSGYKTFFYGNFDGDHARWMDYPAGPRFCTPYCGLRNRIGILSEAYSYAEYRERVLATRAFVHNCFSWAAGQREQIADLLKTVDDDTRAAGRDPQPDDTVAIRSRMAPFKNKVDILGFVEETGPDGRSRATATPRTYSVEHHGLFEPVLSVTRPWAYALPNASDAVIAVLQRHGLALETLREDVELEVERYTIETVDRQERAFQGHHLVTVETARRAASERLSAGTILVKTAQPLGSLAVFLLEPQSDDGLCKWNFFDRGLEVGAEFPVLRLPAGTDTLLTRALPARHDLPDAPRPMVFDDLLARRFNVSGSPIAGISWIDDEHFVLRRNEQLYKFHAASGRSEPYQDRSAMQAALTDLDSLDEDAAGRLVRKRLNLDDERSGAVFDRDNDLYYARLDGGHALQLTTTPDVREEFPTFSPDGKHVAFVREDNLYTVDVAQGRERALTSESIVDVRNGKADWVYFEELFGRSWPAMWWSPDSSAIAYLRFDDRGVDTFTIAAPDDEPQRIEATKYPKAGTDNPLVDLGIVELSTGKTRFVELNDYEPTDRLLSRVGWWPDSRSVFVYVQNRIQSWVDLCRADRETGSVHTMFRDTTPAWVEPRDRPLFLDDGSFLWTSERSGSWHVYRYDASGNLLNAVTSGPWVVRRVHTVDEAGGWLYFSANRDNPIGLDLYRVRLDGTGLKRLTREHGTHRTTVSPNGQYYVDQFSSHRRPTQVRLCDRDGRTVRTLDSNPVHDLERVRVRPAELLTIATPDGFDLQASLLKPPDFDPQKKYPVWFQTYAGPQAPTVRDAWSSRGLRDQVLSEMGIVLLRCDPRSASGRGARHAWSAYRQLGVQEMADIRVAIEWLKSHAWVDGARIGMSGHSYGGFMTAYCMTHSDLFAAGIAGAPVTDWRLYDTIYTERYMSTPQDNPEGYSVTSVVEAADQLSGRLMILHGAMDDNVHLENTLRLVSALQRAGKQFDLMVYPNARHGLFGRHYQNLQMNFIRKHMLPE